MTSIQDRTTEFKSVLAQVHKRQATAKIGAQRQSLLSAAEKSAANGNGAAKPRRSEFARRAAEIGRGISGTMGKLEKLAQRKALKTHAYSPIRLKVLVLATSCILTNDSGKAKVPLRRSTGGDQ